MSPTDLLERYKIACDLQQDVDESVIEEKIKLHYQALGLEPKPCKRFVSLRAAWSSRSARAVRYAWAARDVRYAWAAWAARDAWKDWSAWSAWDAWDAWDVRYAWAAKDAWAARDCRAARNAWSSRSAWARNSWDVSDVREDWEDWDAMWDATYITAFCIGAAQVNNQKVLDIWMPIFEALEHGLWFYWYQDDCFCWVPRPVMRFENKRLHCSTGPAFELPDEKLYYLNGVPVTEELVMTSAERLDPKILLKEKNAEVRREIVRKIGIERVCQKLGTKVLDKQGDYELLNLNLGDGRARPYLKMKNPSIATWHLEGVSPEIKTVKKALAWRNGIETPPDILT